MDHGRILPRERVPHSTDCTTNTEQLGSTAQVWRNRASQRMEYLANQDTDDVTTIRFFGFFTFPFPFSWTLMKARVERFGRLQLWRILFIAHFYRRWRPPDWYFTRLRHFSNSRRLIRCSLNFTRPWYCDWTFTVLYFLPIRSPMFTMSF